MPSSPREENDDFYPNREGSPSPPLSGRSTPSIEARTHLNSPEISFESRHSPSLSVGSMGRLNRRVSDSSLLSSEDAHRRWVNAELGVRADRSRDSPSPSEEGEDVMESMATSVWEGESFVPLGDGTLLKIARDDAGSSGQGRSTIKVPTRRAWGIHSSVQYNPAYLYI
jgi:hypothetical protein